jgi:protoporphyrinogen oxidase
MDNKKIAIIGAGPMGLACAYELLEKNYAVDIYEKDDRIGGMSACFDFDGLTIERYYHFICHTDFPLLDLLKKLEIYHHLQWRDTKMGFFYQGTLYKWGNPFHLLTFPQLDLLSKLRYALHVFYTKNINDWHRLDQKNANVWLKHWVGEKAYRMLWEYLFELKFYEYKENISAAWIGTRIKRVALSRKNLLTESLGYLVGGSETLLEALKQQIIARSGQIYLQARVEKILTENDRITGISVNGEKRGYDIVTSTIPLAYVPRIIPQLPQSIKNKIDAIKNCGVACVILKLRQPITENFWLNINDIKMKIPGIIEYSNLCPMSANIVYVPYYMPKTHPKYSQDEALYFQEVFGYLKHINPAFSQDWVLSKRLSRYEFAQPICTPHFFQQLPPMKTPIAGFLMADTSYYYPEDRSISESVRIGKRLAEIVNDG